ncbi:ClpXP protease specificity-enhancing factor SspB [Paracoccaceae bacterium]|nr:ClpXP protease specificity-enhancing factor SspB [Paracoccaceae bacterium]
MADMNYKVLIENAMLNMVRDILKKISKDGLPKNHHFLITFFSRSKGVIIPDWMKEKYPDKMTIIIRNWFENLNVTDNKFEISLNFNNNVERLTIPFNSLELFADPSVDFAISFDQINSAPSSETKIDKEPNNQIASKKEALRKKNENVINLKNFKK